uniref:Septin-type G domain-containing protein n=1 Tax=Scylla olivacea TaxID=85551 RepID=A0A0P4WC47_SCYOL
MEEHDEKPLKLSVIEDLPIAEPGSPCIYNIPLNQVMRDEDGRIGKFEYGYKVRNDISKVVMMVGATGSGKTTLINGLINYVFGVEWDDSFRFKMIVENRLANQAESQTKDITCYTLHHQNGFQIPYSLTIIDTPGFGDTEGVERDRQIIEQIRKFFSTPGDNGISHIDAVGFVAQSSQARLSPVQRYIFDNILALFGKDIRDNIFLLLTFADGQKPQVLSAVAEAEIPYKKFFKFNNSAIYSQKDEDDDSCQNFTSYFWIMGCKSFKMFLEQLLSVESKSLVLTKDVLEERKRIEVYIEGIQQDIQVGLSKLETLNREAKLLKEHEEDVNRNKNFTFEVEEDVFEIVNLNWERSMTNCMTCKRTCCKDCMVFLSPALYMCHAMGWNGNCNVCPRKCKFTEHKSCSFMFDIKRKKSQRTVDDIRLRYEKAQEKKLSAQNLVDRIRSEFDSVQKNILAMAESVRKSLQRLKEIALRPDPLTTLEYIDMLKENEKRQAKPGWLERIGQLDQLRQRAEHIKDIASGNTKLLQEHEHLNE